MIERQSFAQVFGWIVLAFAAIVATAMAVGLMLAPFVFVTVGMLLGVLFVLSLPLLWWSSGRWTRAPAPALSQVDASLQAPGVIISSKGVRTELDMRDLFRYLSEVQTTRLMARGEAMRIESGEVMGRVGEPGAHLFVIIEGMAELAAPSSLGEITVRVAGPGESFPLACLVGEGILITTATALTDIIPRHALLELCTEDTALGMRIYAAIADVLARRYRGTLEHLTTSTEKALKEAGFWANV